MTRKKRRLYIVGLVMLGVGSATALGLTAFQDNVVYFYSPGELAAGEAPQERRVRLGGLVVPGSIDRGDNGTVSFTVTDGEAQIPVTYSGMVPDLFRENQGVVAKGQLGPGGTFQAQSLLAKHDENYMPNEVAQALKKSGNWQHYQETGEVSSAGGGS